LPGGFKAFAIFMLRVLGIPLIYKDGEFDVLSDMRHGKPSGRVVEGFLSGFGKLILISGGKRLCGPLWAEFGGIFWGPGRRGIGFPAKGVLCRVCRVV
jgi:hypothetical protein